jgi:antitoxin component YwqK of YwqJK toxin-antitoxin module
LNGNLWTESTRVAGDLHGSYKVHESSGELYEQKTFRDGVLHGLATKKFNGETFEERLYSAGALLSRKIKKVADATFDLDYIASLADI